MRVLRYVEDSLAKNNYLREVISHSLLKNANMYRPADTDTLVNWTVVRGGTVEELLRLFKRRMTEVTIDTTYVLHIWHNSIRDINISYANTLIDKYETLLRNVNQNHNMRHRVVWAEADYPPENERFFGRIDRLNIALRQANSENGYAPCKPHRITTPEKNGRRRMVESRWEEAVRGSGPGYHVRENWSFLTKTELYVYLPV